MGADCCWEKSGMMEDDNRVYVRIRGQWRALDPGCELHEIPPDRWPIGNENAYKYAELIVWRGKVIKDRWHLYNRAEFLEGIREL